MKEDVRSPNSICPSCFSTIGIGGVCPACGKRADAVSNPPPAMPLRCIVGSRYLTGEVLGMGGFGITYIAWDLSYSRKVTVKEYFPKEYASRGEDGCRVDVLSSEAVSAFNHWLKAFVEEAKILMRIKHLHGVVKLHDFFERNNTAYMVTDYIDGKTLRTLLTERGYKVPWEEALNLIRPVLESLAILHAYGVIHKDISPENIMIEKNRYVKLIDFGAAELYKLKESNPFGVRKAGYSPIELYRPGTAGNGPWTDIYQVGATLYNCITGYIPPVATERDRTVPLPSPAALGVSVPPYVETAVRKALALQPTDRYQSVGELCKALRL